MKKIISATLGIIGFITILGTAGSIDVNSITLSQGIAQMMIGLGCFLVSALMCHNETF